MAKKNNFENIVDFFFELGTLRKVIRAHQQALFGNDASDNIASHTFRVCFIGYFLAQIEKADAFKVVMMCLVHDIPEIRTGDQNNIHKKYVKAFEDEVINDQLNGLPFSEFLKNLFFEYEERKTKEAKIAKDADILDEIFLLKEYSATGNKEAERWLKNHSHSKFLNTKTAKEIYKVIIKKNISDWWKTFATFNKRR
ncbi:hypothetical protein HRbin34_00314 [bacterium HR34]|nr:hypothetical protein HRbin34_00314 [bacterium HR34]